MANSVIIGDYKYTSEIPNYAKAEVVDKTKSSYGDMLSSVQIGGQTCYVDDLRKCFSGCSSLVNAPALSTRAETMLQCFSGCSSLVTAPTIPSGVNIMGYCFSGCSSLINAPAIPNGVMSLDRCFSGCSSLVNAPTIPNNVEQMRNCFERCQNLSGEIKINAVSYVWYDDVFKDTAKGIWLTGSNNKLANMAATANNNNVFVGEIPLSYRLTAERVAYDGQTEPVPEGLWAHVKLTIDWSNFAENSIDSITLKNGIVSINPTWYSDAAKTNAITLPNWRPNSASTTIHCWIDVTSATHVLSVTVADRYHTGVVITFTVPQQFRTVEFLRGGHGVAFGQPATQDGMFINMDLAIKEYSNIVKNVYDVFYPVGSYYETDLPSAIPSGQSTPTSTDLENLGATWFDPNYAWGGTWVKETSAVLCSAENVVTKVKTFSINRARGSHADVTAPTVTDYNFVAWVATATQGWVGSVYPAQPTAQTATFWVSVSDGGTNNMNVNAVALYRKNDNSINRWHRTA